MAVISRGKASEAQKAERLDAEFFDPADLALIKKLASEGGRPLGEICDVLNGRTPEEYSEKGETPIVRSGDLDAPFIYPECDRDFLRAKASSKLLPLKNG